jgi:predicted nucleotidyltransferase
MIERGKISSIVSSIAASIDPDKIYLFGSYATGMANEDSDIDLLIVKDSDQPKYVRNIEVQRLLIGSKLPVDVVVYTNDEFENERKKSYSFLNSAIEGALLMYERK